jgi:hypothetical protein
MSRVLERPAPAPSTSPTAPPRHTLTWVLAVLLVLVIGTLGWAMPRAARAHDAAGQASALASEVAHADALVSDLRAQLDGLRRARLAAGLTGADLDVLRSRLTRRIDVLRARIADLEAAAAAAAAPRPSSDAPSPIPRPPPPCPPVLVYDEATGTYHIEHPCP